MLVWSLPREARMRWMKKELTDPTRYIDLSYYERARP